MTRKKKTKPTRKITKRRRPRKKLNKIYVLDTSALLQDPACLTFYEGSTVILPVTVLGELDKHKTRMDAVGKNARHIPRLLAKYRKRGDYLNGVTLEYHDITIKFFIEKREDIPDSLDSNKPDNRILSVCLSFKKEPGNKVFLVTNDMYLSLKAEVYGIKALEFRGTDLLNIFEYKGHRVIEESVRLNINKIYNEKVIKCPKNYKFNENECCLIRNSNSKQSVRCRFKDGNLYLINPNIRCNKIKPLNNEQTYVMDLLLDPTVPLVTITGKAGTGKTLLTVACGIQHVLHTEKYRKLVVSRSLELLSGRDKLGYLKGGLDEKLAPFILPLRDAVDQVIGEDKDGFAYMQKDNKKLEVEPLQYIRGRSITNTFFIVDEVQNLTKQDVKTIVTRMGEGSKIVLLGDLDQIDNSYLTKSSNGLAQVIEKFKDSPLTGHIELAEGVRSPLATEASLRL